MAKPVTKTAPHPSGLRLALREFLRGFTDLSLLTLAVCFCSFVVTSVFMLWLFSPSGLSSDLSVFVPRSRNDAEGFATVEATKLSRTSAKTPTLVILGSSAVSQMVGRGDPIRSFLADHPSGPWSVGILTTPLQSPLDQFALLDGILSERTEASPPLVVMLGVGMPRLGWTNSRTTSTAMQQRIGIRSEWLDAELIRLGGSTAPNYPVSALDTAPFLIRNGLKSMIRLSMLSPATQTVDSFARGDEGGNRGREPLLESIEAGRESPNEYLDLMVVFADRINSTPNSRLVFIEEPLSPGIVEASGHADGPQEFRARMNAFATHVEAEFWPVARDAQLEQADYFDDIHLRLGAPQERCQQVILVALRQMIEGSMAQ